MNTCMKYILPGGYVKNGIRYRDAYIKPLTGQIEQDIVEAYELNAPTPDITTEILVKAVSHISEKKIDREIIDSLCIADRQFLMIQISILLGDNSLLLHVRCRDCNELLDIQVNKSELPVIEASDAYPFTTIELRGKKVGLRVPSGKDQHELAELNERDALFLLLKNCVMSVEEKPTSNAFVKSLTDHEIEFIESALEDISPALGLKLSANCPECNSNQVINMNPYDIDKSGLNRIFDEVHSIATNYHWSEIDILSMHRSRRRHYLSLIETNNMEGC